MPFGFDPELFVMAKKANTYATSIHLVTDNNKLKALKAEDDSGWSFNNVRDCVYGKTDGFAFELNSVPFTCRDQFVPLVGSLLKDWYREYGDHWKLSAIPVRKLNVKSRANNPPMGVNEFGCLPDMNAYTMEEKTPFRDDYHDAYRYTGGHLHHSLLFETYDNRAAIIGGTNIIIKRSDDERLIMAGAATIMMDLHVGLPLVAMLGNVNDFGEVKRREYYGQAGSFRVKDYGVEYRVPSSAIMLSPSLLAWSIGASRSRAQRAEMLDGVSAVKHINVLKKQHDFKEVQNIINTHDVKAANVYLNKIRSLYAPAFVRMLCKADSFGVGFNTNFFESWALDKKIVNHSYIGNVSAMSSLSGNFLTDNTKNVFTNESFPFLTIQDKLQDVKEIKPW